MIILVDSETNAWLVPPPAMQGLWRYAQAGHGRNTETFQRCQAALGSESMLRSVLFAKQSTVKLVAPEQLDLG